MAGSAPGKVAVPTSARSGLLAGWHGAWPVGVRGYLGRRARDRLVFTTGHVWHWQVDSW